LNIRIGAALDVLPEGSTLLLMEGLEVGDVEAKIFAGKKEDMVASTFGKTTPFTQEVAGDAIHFQHESIREVV